MKKEIESALRYDQGKLNLLHIHPKLFTDIIWEGLRGFNLISLDMLEQLSNLEYWFYGLENLKRDNHLELLQLATPVLEYGAKKYSALNYTKGMLFSRNMQSLRRHGLKLAMGQDLDEYLEGVDPIELKDSTKDFSGLPHVGHIACNILFQYTWDMVLTPEQYESFDDRKDYWLGEQK